MYTEQLYYSFSDGSEAGAVLPNDTRSLPLALSVDGAERTQEGVGGEGEGVKGEG